MAVKSCFLDLRIAEFMLPPPRADADAWSACVVASPGPPLRGTGPRPRVDGLARHEHRRCWGQGGASVTEDTLPLLEGGAQGLQQGTPGLESTEKPEAVSWDLARPTQPLDPIPHRTQTTWRGSLCLRAQPLGREWSSQPWVPAQLSTPVLQPSPARISLPLPDPGIS